MILVLDPDIARHFPAGPAAFDAVMALTGESFRALEGRCTLRVMIGGKPYFIKQHRGIGWGEIFKNLLQGRRPITGARHEWEALKKCAALGVRAPRVFGYGERGINPARLESFIIMEALEPTQSLEDLTATWLITPPSFAFKKKIIEAVADMARTLHTHGMNHRDFYLCHFLVDMSVNPEQNLRLSLIDLHRAGIRSSTPTRWVMKDLAGLVFSSKNMGLTRRDALRFIKRYRGRDLRSVLSQESTFWEHIASRGEALYREHQK